MAAEQTKQDILTRLPEWKAEYEKLGLFIAAAEALVGETDDQGEVVTPLRQANSRARAIAPDEFAGMSTSEAIKAYLNLMGKGNPQGPREMAKAMVTGGRDADEKKAYANVASALKRMNKANEIRQIRRGQWGLAAWYGGSAPAKKGARVSGEQEAPPSA